MTDTPTPSAALIARVRNVVDVGVLRESGNPSAEIDLLEMADALTAAEAREARLRRALQACVYAHERLLPAQAAYDRARAALEGDAK